MCGELLAGPGVSPFRDDSGWSICSLIWLSVAAGRALVDGARAGLWMNRPQKRDNGTTFPQISEKLAPFPHSCASIPKVR